MHWCNLGYFDVEQHNQHVVQRFSFFAKHESELQLKQYVSLFWKCNLPVQLTYQKSCNSKSNSQPYENVQKSTNGICDIISIVIITCIVVIIIWYLFSHERYVLNSYQLSFRLLQLDHHKNIQSRRFLFSLKIKLISSKIVANKFTKLCCKTCWSQFFCKWYHFNCCYLI